MAPEKFNSSNEHLNVFCMSGVDESSQKKEDVITNTVSNISENLDELLSSGNKSTNVSHPSCHSAQLHLASQHSQHSDTAPKTAWDDNTMSKTKTGQEATLEFVAESVAKSEECLNETETAHFESDDLNGEKCESCETSTESEGRGELCNKGQITVVDGNVNASANDSGIDSENEECIDNPINREEWENMFVKAKVKNSPRLNKMYDRQYRLLGKKIVSECEDEVEINKVAKLATELARKKYKFPKPEDEEKLENMVTEDNRSVLEMYRDIIDCIHEQVTDEEAQFLSSVIGYDCTVKQYSSEGVPLPDGLVKQLSAEYKSMFGIKNIGKSYEFMRGLKIEEKKKNINKMSGPEEGGAWVVKTVDKFSLSEISAFLDFINKDMSVLEIRRHKRQAEAIKRLFKKGKGIGGGRLHQFLTTFNEKYKFKGEYIDPITNPQVFSVLAPGDRLEHAKCQAESDLGNVELDLLIDSGATHNLLPKKIIDKFKLKILQWQPRRGFPLTTAGSKVNNAVMSECLLRLKIIDENKFMDVPFLVNNENLNVHVPILGKAFLNDFQCDEKHRSESDIEKKALICNMRSLDTGEQVRGLLPTTVWPEARGSELYLLEGDSEDSGTNDSEEEDEEALVHAVRAGDKADDLLSYLGGDGVLVSQPVRDDIDSEAFKKVDLMEALGTEPQKKVKKTKNKFEKWEEKLKKVNEKYVNSFARGDVQCGEFKLDVWVDPDVIPGKTAAQAKRKKQDHTAFGAVQKQMEKLENQGIIEISNDQSTDKYVHNLLTVPKKPSGSTLRQWTKADQAIEGRNAKMSKEDLPVRVLADLTSLNKCLRSTPAISLPEEHEVKTFVKNKIISLYDIKNGYFSLKVKESAKHLFNFYYKDMIWTYGRMPQGLSSAPFYFMAAMAKMLSEAAWIELEQKFKDKFTYLFKCAKNFADISKYYLDDIILATPVVCKCKEGSYSCEKGFECDKIEHEATMTLHLEAHEAILWAVERAGMLLEDTKCSHFTQDSFVFLGVEYCGTDATYSISKERAASVLSFRVPRSIAELNSRLSSMFYSNAFLPSLKKVALRLTRMVKSGHFRWRKEENDCFNNLKLLTAIAISKKFFDPKAHLFVLSDASKYAGSYCTYQLLQTGEMELIETDTVILSGAESRNSPVQRELANMVWAINKNEKYLLSSENPVHVVGDAHCIQYLKNQRLWDSRCGHVALLLSQYSNLNFLWMPGKYLGLVDQLSRGFHEVFIEKKESQLSKEIANILPPLPENVRNKLFKMSARELSDYVMNMKCAPVKIDIYDKGAFCNQTYREDDIRTLYNECEPLQVLLAFLKDPYNPEHLTSNSAKHFFSVLSAANKTKIDKFIADNGLDKMRDVLQTIDFKTTWKSFYPSQVQLKPPEKPGEGEGEATTLSPTITVITRSGTGACKKTWSPEMRCEHYHHFKDEFGMAEIEIFSNNQKKYEHTMSSLKKNWEKSNDKNKINLLNSVEAFLQNDCIIKRFMETKEVAKILRSMPCHKWFLPETPEFAFIPYFCQEGPDVMLKEIKGELCITLNKAITLDSLEFIKLECLMAVFDTGVGWREVTDEKYRSYHVSSFVPCTSCSSISVFNITGGIINLKRGTVLFKLEKPGQGDKIFSFFKMQQLAGRKLLQGLFDIKLQTSYNNLENIFIDYLELAHVNLIRPVLNEDLAAGRMGDLKNRQKLVKVHKRAIAEDDGFVNSIQKRINNTKDELYEGAYNLSILLFNHHLRINKCRLTKEDILSLQNSDNLVVQLRERILKRQSNQSEENGGVAKFVIKKGIIYKQVYNKVRNITYDLLVVPRFIMKEICQILHYQKQLHLHENESVALIQSAFWSFDMHSLARKARQSCFACLYGAKPKARQTQGNLRAHLRDKIEVKSVIECDLMFLAKDSILQTDIVIVFCCPLTNYTVAYPMQDRQGYDVCKAIGLFVSSVGVPKILKTDAGNEYCNAKVRALLEKLGITHYISATKNSTSTVERQIQELKGVLNSLMQSESLQNNRWSEYLPLACCILQCRPVKKGAFLSRLQAFLSPLHYQSQAFRLIEFNNEQHTYSLHKNYLMDKRKSVKAEGQIVRGDHWEVGQLVKTHIPRAKQSSLNKSNQLLPICDRFMKVVDPPTAKQAAICEDLLSGEKGKFDNTQIRRLKVEDWPLPKQIQIKNLEEIPDINQKEFAKKLFSRQDSVQPFCFTICNSFPEKSILRKNSQFSGKSPRRLYKGVLESKKYRGQLGAYAEAMNIRESLGMQLPQWMEELFSQRKGYGKFRVLLESLNEPEVTDMVYKSTHDRSVKWKDGICDNSFEKGGIAFMWPEARVFCVSTREMANCFYNMCSLQCDQDCGIARLEEEPGENDMNDNCQ